MLHRLKMSPKDSSFAADFGKPHQPLKLLGRGGGGGGHTLLWLRGVDFRASSAPPPPPASRPASWFETEWLAGRQMRNPREGQSYSNNTERKVVTNAGM